MNRQIFNFCIIITILGISFTSYAKKRVENPKAEIKVGYDYHYKFWGGNGGVSEKEIPFILIANPVKSKFYCPKTEFLDSLASTPSGIAKKDEMFNAAAKAYSENKDRSAMENVTYRTHIYVLKDIAASVSTVYDSGGLGEYGYYSEPFSELNWKIDDECKKVILGYECLKAEINYHGRKWSVWFTPEIPIQDGSWKFCGLPGLILEASEPEGQHHFIATGIENSDKDIVPVYNSNKYKKMKRIDMLKDRRYSKENSMSIFKAMTGSDLGVKDAPVTEESRKYDFLETDYH